MRDIRKGHPIDRLTARAETGRQAEATKCRAENKRKQLNQMANFRTFRRRAG